MKKNCTKTPTIHLGRLQAKANGKPKPKKPHAKIGQEGGWVKRSRSSNLSVPKKIDRTIHHYPPKCLSCPLFEKCKGTICVPAEKRYTIDVIVKTDVVEHRAYRMNACVMEGGMPKGEFPEGVNAYIRTPPPLNYLDYYDLKYDEIIRIAREENPPPVSAEVKRGRKKKGKVLSLIERLAGLKDAMLLFARNFAVPFTNNAAEQTIRNLKSKIKVAGNFRSDDGAGWHLKIRSYIDSAGKHGVNAFEAVTLAFTDSPALCFGF